jgi:hypothetical protein
VAHSFAPRRGSLFSAHGARLKILPGVEALSRGCFYSGARLLRQPNSLTRRRLGGGRPVWLFSQESGDHAPHAKSRLALMGRCSRVICLGAFSAELIRRKTQNTSASAAA